MHRVRFPAQLGEHPGRNERRDEEHEPDANHGEHAITAQTARNRVFPSKKSSFLAKQQVRFYKLLACGKIVTLSVPATWERNRRRRPPQAQAEAQAA